ncbi:MULTISPECIES: class I SAM-dependent methyltransferase [Haloarcula]|uniref:Type 11 methyltransferase n=1 Tax=Haloarcula amylolytica JCM 13557 TaxID=1227452 RepID=M0K5H9_9EURY|nr:class I SAM-dependent methyltransferase [Haloarcula amylolytica]EMA16083.1 type 11 methyltransferase [Haloarcula amylolytica JCM 13557]
MDSTDIREEWADRSGEYSPAYYAYYGADETSELVQSILAEHVEQDAAILEVGCSSGRHLAALSDAGYSDLTGVDINADALDVLAETYPDLAATGSFHAMAIEEFVTDVADDAYDVVFSVETLQHLHPDVDWAFEELARIVDDLLITVENEGGDPGEVNYVDDNVPLYYRDWNAVFTDCGLTEVDSMDGKRDTVRIFQAPK